MDPTQYALCMPLNALLLIAYSERCLQGTPPSRSLSLEQTSCGPDGMSDYSIRPQFSIFTVQQIRNNWGETAYDIAAAVFEVWICEVCRRSLNAPRLDSPTVRSCKKQKPTAGKVPRQCITHLECTQLFRLSYSTSLDFPIAQFIFLPFLCLLTRFVLISHQSEQQRLDVRLKTLATSGGRPKFSASGLGKHGRRGPFELCLPAGSQISAPGTPTTNGASGTRSPGTPGASASGSGGAANGTPGSGPQTYISAWRSDVVLPLLEQPFVLPSPTPGKTREGAERSHFWL